MKPSFLHINKNIGNYISKEVIKIITKDLIPGINIRDENGNNFAEMICKGEKNIETRNSNSLKPYINKRVRAIRTGINPPLIVGEFTLGEPIFYETEEEFKNDISKHKINKESRFYFSESGKYGYPILNPTLYKKPYAVVGKSSIIARRNQPYIDT